MPVQRGLVWLGMHRLVWLQGRRSFLFLPEAGKSHLPAALLATSLSAASTIVLTHCSKTQVGRYGYIFPQTAYRMDCGLLFVDQNGPSGMQILGIESYSASPPAKISIRSYFTDVVPDRPEFYMQDSIVFRAADAAKPGNR